MFAVISYKGNQYKVEPNKECRIDLVEDAEEKKKITFSEVLLVSDEKQNHVGTPFINGASVEAEFAKDVRGDKVEVFKFHSKKRYKKTLGHTQSYSIIKVINIKLKNEK
jgi:large subunit ribosomal protein L21